MKRRNWVHRNQVSISSYRDSNSKEPKEESEKEEELKEEDIEGARKALVERQADPSGSHNDHITVIHKENT